MSERIEMGCWWKAQLITRETTQTALNNVIARDAFLTWYWEEGGLYSNRSESSWQFQWKQIALQSEWPGNIKSVRRKWFYLMFFLNLTQTMTALCPSWDTSPYNATNITHGKVATYTPSLPLSPRWHVVTVPRTHLHTYKQAVNFVSLQSFVGLEFFLLPFLS